MSEVQPLTNEQRIERLGYAGLIPFVALTVLLFLVNDEAHPFVAMALTGYGASIVSFLGGIHWGLGLQAQYVDKKFHIVWGVIPSLLVWISFFLPAYAGLVVLSVLLVACYVVDRKTWPQAGLHQWMTLRFRLTVVATLSCLMGAGAT
ncbi:MAG: DUF3429 domain-containing protein [Limnohabitans sp.]|nr:DUF3429 domain-containing protein [Limnohabitans sp.]